MLLSQFQVDRDKLVAGWVWSADLSACWSKVWRMFEQVTIANGDIFPMT